VPVSWLCAQRHRLMTRFFSSFPLELDDRISPTQFQILINTVNAHLINAYSPGRAVIDNLLMIFTFHLSLLFTIGHFEKVSPGIRRMALTSQELHKLEASIEKMNKETFNAVGLNVLSPRDVGLQFVSQQLFA
jgi:hypothetical protein